MTGVTKEVKYVLLNFISHTIKVLNLKIVLSVSNILNSVLNQILLNLSRTVIRSKLKVVFLEEMHNPYGSTHKTVRTVVLDFCVCDN